MHRFSKRPSPSMVVACLALTVSLSGWGYAATVIPKNSVGTAQLKKNAVVAAKVKNGSLLAADFKAGQLPAGPAGPQGDKGEKGEKGEKGDKGETGSSGVSEYQVVSAVTASNSDFVKAIAALCPSGKRALGGGGTIFGGGPTAITSSRQNGTSGTGWIIQAREITTHTGNWYLEAIAICAKVS